MDPGKRESLVTFERRQVLGTDDTGGEIVVWDELVQAWARVNYGTGIERREAAQEKAVQAATFECEWNPTLDGVEPTDRISFGGDYWDIISRAPLGHREIHFSALRAA